MCKKQLRVIQVSFCPNYCLEAMRSRSSYMVVGAYKLHIYLLGVPTVLDNNLEDIP